MDAPYSMVVYQLGIRPEGSTKAQRIAAAAGSMTGACDRKVPQSGDENYNQNMDYSKAKSSSLKQGMKDVLGTAKAKVKSKELVATKFTDSHIKAEQVDASDQLSSESYQRPFVASQDCKNWKSDSPIIRKYLKDDTSHAGNKKAMDGAAITSLRSSKVDGSSDLSGFLRKLPCDGDFTGLKIRKKWAARPTYL